MATSKTPVFVREATGLVRSMNWVDLMFLNVISFGGAWSIIYALEYAPFYGGDPAVSLLLTAPGILALLGVYYIFNTSMPRSGGDYVYISRTIHPAIGFAANFVGYTLFLWFWIADAATVFTSNGLAQTLSVFGTLTGSTSAVNAASQLTVPAYNFTIGTIALVVFAIIVMFSKRLYFAIQNVLMTIAVVGLAVIAILLGFALSNPSSFQNNLNSYAAKTGISLAGGAYQNLTASGASLSASGYTHSITSISANLYLVPLWFTVLFWVFVSNYLGGETKNVKVTARRALFGSFAIIFVATIVILETAYYALGYNFLLGADNIALGYVPNPFGALPNLTLFVSVLANNPYLVIFLGIGIIAGFVLVAPQSMILMSRILFSYSFDRMAPSGIASVSTRFGTPVKATLVALVGAEVMLAILSGVLIPSVSSTLGLLLYSYAGLATITLTFTFISISAIIFPYRRKSLYEVSSSVRTKVLGVPLITWLGIISLVYSLSTIIAYSTDRSFYLGSCSAGAVLSCDFNPFLAFLAIMFVASVGYYFGVRQLRRSKGIPFDMAFAEIPPE
jgi:APA family basic amino acid/polyamine antiporter